MLRRRLAIHNTNKVFSVKFDLSKQMNLGPPCNLLMRPHRWI